MNTKTLVDLYGARYRALQDALAAEQAKRCGTCAHYNSESHYAGRETGHGQCREREIENCCGTNTPTYIPPDFRCSAWEAKP